jgi:quinol monooxygenase YgiN
MSVLVIVKVKGDTAAFRRSLDEKTDEYNGVRERAQAAGAVHHRFGIGDGYVVAVDEWETPDQFEAFFTEPKMQEFIGSIGADTSQPPEITVTEAVESPDQF